MLTCRHGVGGERKTETQDQRPVRIQKWRCDTDTDLVTKTQRHKHMQRNILRVSQEQTYIHISSDKDMRIQIPEQ